MGDAASHRNRLHEPRRLGLDRRPSLGVAPALSPVFPHRVEQAEQDEQGDNKDAWMRKPACAVDSRRNKKIGLGDAAENESQKQRRPRPVKLHHEQTQRAEEQHHDHVAETVLDREAAEKNQQQQKWNQ